MPEELERKLKAEAKKKKLKANRAESYVYGTMRKTGWKPGSQTYDPKAPSKIWK